MTREWVDSPHEEISAARTLVNSRRRRFVLVLCGLIGAFLAWEALTRFVAYTSDAYVRSDLISVAPQVTGPIVAIHVQDNQSVRRGDLLASIDPTPFQLDVTARKAEIAEAEAQARADRDASAAAKDEAASAAAALELAQVNQRRFATLSNEGDIARQALDNANETLRSAQARFDTAQATISKAQQTLEMHEAAIARAQAQLATARWRLDRTEIHAPADGAINNLTLRVGDTARAEAPLIGIVDASAWRIIANYKEDYLPRLKVGATAWVWLDSHPWRFYRAHIAGIGRAISRNPDAPELLPYVAPTTDWIRLQRRFPVTLLLDDPPPDLTLYMGADARALIFP